MRHATRNCSNTIPRVRPSRAMLLWAGSAAIADTYTMAKRRRKSARYVHILRLTLKGKQKIIRSGEENNRDNIDYLLLKSKSRTISFLICSPYGRQVK